MTQIPQLHPSEAFALGYSWGNYCAYRDEFGNKNVRFLPYLIDAFERFTAQPPTHREIPLVESDFPHEGLEWHQLDYIIFELEVAYSEQDTRVAFVRHLKQPQNGTKKQNGKYVFQDATTPLRRQLFDYFSKIADVRETDYRYFHRDIRDVLFSLFNLLPQGKFECPDDLSEDSKNIDKHVLTLIAGDESLKQAFLAGRAFGRTNVLSQGYEQELRMYCRGEAPNEMPEISTFEQQAEEEEMNSIISASNAMRSPTVHPLDDLGFVSTCSAATDALFKSPLLEGADPELVEHLRECDDDEYFSEYAQRPIDDLMHLAALNAHFDEAMRFVLRKLRPQDQVLIRADLQSDNPRDLRHNYPNTPSDPVATHMAAGQKMFSDNTLQNPEVIFLHYVGGIEKIIKYTFRQAWGDFEQKHQENFSYKTQTEKRPPPNFTRFLEDLNKKSLREGDFVVERITSTALEIFTRHRNLGVHGSSAALQSGEEMVLWQEAVGVHHLAQGLYNRIHRYVSRLSELRRLPESGSECK